MSLFEGQNLEIAKSARSFLFNLGITGATNLPLLESVSMFENLVAADPEEAYARFGLGFAKMVEGEYDVAHEAFTHPSLQNTVYADNAKAHDAMAYFFDDEPSQGRALCEEILASNASESVKSLAQEAIKNYG